MKPPRIGDAFVAARLCLPAPFNVRNVRACTTLIVRSDAALPIFTAAFMASIKPFAALRPKPEFAPRICELPYDVMSSEEARAMAAGNPLSFLHVSKPEIVPVPATSPAGLNLFRR